MRSIPYLAFLLAASSLEAQTPDTDIYVAPLRLKDGWVTIGAAVNATRRPGYDNQPHFTADGGSILYTAGMEGQTEIFRYHLGTRRSVRVTTTPESEYSPTPVPGGFTVVRVERDSTQRLWRFDPAGKSARVLIPMIRPVGYHAWIDDQRTALFVLGSPATLRIGSTRSGRADTVTAAIGRAMQKIPRWPGVSFVQRAGGDTTTWMIQRVHADTRVITPIARTLPGGEYHAWTPRGALLGKAGSKIYEWSPINGGEWREAGDFTALGIRLSRIAVSPNGRWVAFVGERLQ